ncbi:MAG: hypothetical protein HWD62_03775 [Cyclobacteriaceae bacterium]|nr:MAG: hypothetical protein HWD62_03775 [Cyclobacteriaceae bacterium]
MRLSVDYRKYRWSGVIAIAICLLLIGCSKTDTIESKIVLKISQCSEPCFVSIKEIATFKWDKLYVFNLPASPEEINDALGINYPYYVEFTRPMIFLNGDSLVYYENNSSNVEGVVDDQVIFGRGSDATKYKIITPENSIFKSDRKISGNKMNYYELIPI